MAIPTGFAYYPPPDDRCSLAHATGVRGGGITENGHEEQEGKMKRMICAGLVAALALAGCQSGQGGFGAPRTVAGAGLGALAGAGIGSLIGGNRTSNMLIGAGIGALTGGAIGSYMDRQQADLQQQLQGTGVQVRRQGDVIVLNMPSNVTFATDSSDVQPQFYATLTQVANTLKQYPQTLIDIGGHTDSTGTADYNQRLSEERALSVAQFFVSQGVQTERMQVRGYGLTRPVADNNTAAGRQQNRRVEIEIRPFTG